MFGLPPGNPLREVVIDLTRDHERTVDGITGVEPPLLRLLEVAIKADTSGASGGSGRSKNSAPLDVTALSLWEGIATVVGNHWPGRGDANHRTMHLIDRLTWWTNQVGGTDNEEHLLEFCEYWRTSIRNLLEPPKTVALRGVRCEACKTRWVKEEREGETTLQPVLTAFMSEEPMRVSCIACGQDWSGLALHLLGD